MRCVTLVLLLAVTPNLAQQSPSPQLAPPDVEAAARLFAALQGPWSCDGGFADGRPLAADLTFTFALDGREIRYQHRDRPPSNLVEDAAWGPDRTAGVLVSVGFAGAAQAISPTFLVAKEWTPESVLFDTRTLTTPLFAANRFQYTLVTPDRLTMVWEVERGGVWRIGDHLDCQKAR